MAAAPVRSGALAEAVAEVPSGLAEEVAKEDWHEEGEAGRSVSAMAAVEETARRLRRA